MLFRSLLSHSLRRELEAAARAVVKIETATEPRFQDLFVQAMAFPHAIAPTPFLANLVDLPARRPGNNKGGAGRRRRGGRSDAAAASAVVSTTTSDQSATSKNANDPTGQKGLST